MYTLDYYLDNETVQVTVRAPTQQELYKHLEDVNWHHYYIEDPRGEVIDEAHCDDKELSRWG